MRHINPITTAILLVALLSFFILKLNSSKNELSHEKKLYQETLTLTNKLEGLQKIYSNKNLLKKSLNRVLALSSVKTANIKQKIGKSNIQLSSISMNKRALNSLMGKLLNGSYYIYSFKIKKLSDEKVSFNMEIKW